MPPAYLLFDLDETLYPSSCGLMQAVSVRMTAFVAQFLQVGEVEAARIRAHAAAVLREAPHPPGACAFLDDAGACRIYAHRPYVCRTQGLPLRWLDFDAPAGPVERRDICPLNEPGVPIEALPAADCWELGPIEARLAALQARRSGGALPRVRLRDLFARSA